MIMEHTPLNRIRNRIEYLSEARDFKLERASGPASLESPSTEALKFYSSHGSPGFILTLKYEFVLILERYVIPNRRPNCQGYPTPDMEKAAWIPTRVFRLANDDVTHRRYREQQDKIKLADNEHILLQKQWDNGGLENVMKNMDKPSE
jgi:hypothetical protein